MTKAEKQKKSFELQYKMVMHPKGITHADLREAAQLIRDLEQLVDCAQRDSITYRDELRKLQMENQFLTTALEEFTMEDDQ